MVKEANFPRALFVTLLVMSAVGAFCVRTEAAPLETPLEFYNYVPDLISVSLAIRKDGRYTFSVKYTSFVGPRPDVPDIDELGTWRFNEKRSMLILQPDGVSGRAREVSVNQRPPATATIALPRFPFQLTLNALGVSHQPTLSPKLER